MARYYGQAVDFSSGGETAGLVSYVDASADPFAGQTAGNGKLIYSAQEGADNLNRYEVNWNEGNYGALDDGVLTYGFWTYEQFLDSYFFELRYANGEAFNDDAYYAETYGAFEEFTASMKELAANSVALWDDLIAISIEAGTPGETSDIMFGQVYMSPAAGAHAYFPQAEALDEYYGTTGYGQTSGDVMTNWLYPGDFEGSGPGDYGWWAITHELGHSFGLAHGGDYNASDDNNGDGVPDPITYANDAYYFQDNQQYTMMSYFSATAIGTAWLDFSRGTEINPSTGQSGYFYFVNAQTPMVHDVLAIQDLYGADYTTRSGDTTYGFNSNAGNVVYDFAQNEVPVITIWDGAGNDTLDLSGYSTNSIININEGAFSSAGHGLYEYRADFGLSSWTEAQVNAFAAGRGYGDGGRPEDNIAIAYGAEIENAVGGSGNDRITGNALNNMLSGGAGNDTIWGGLGKDELIGGLGNDIFVFAETDAADKIRDFDAGDRIDLRAFGIDANDIKIAGNNVFADTDGVKGYDLHIVVQGDKVEMTDIMFA